MAPTNSESIFNGKSTLFSVNRGESICKTISISNSYRTTMTVTFKDNADMNVMLKSQKNKATNPFSYNILWVNVVEGEVPDDLETFIEEKFLEGEYKGVIVSGSGLGRPEQPGKSIRAIREMRAGPVSTIWNIGMDRGYFVFGSAGDMTVLGPKDKRGPRDVKFVIY